MPVSLSYECNCIANLDADVVIGVDEAGRGPLAGPVVCGGFCILNLPHLLKSTDEFESQLLQHRFWRIIQDSKTVAEKDRESVFDTLTKTVTTTQDEGQDLGQDEDDGTFRKVIRLTELSKETENKENDENTENKENKEVEKAIPLDLIFAHAQSSVEEIDAVNILEATMTAMTRVVTKVLKKVRASLSLKCDPLDDSDKKLKVAILIDGNRIPRIMATVDTVDTVAPVAPVAPVAVDVDVKNWLEIASEFDIVKLESVVKGDGKVFSIALGSIVAKVVRDRIMVAIHDSNDDLYNFLENKGYPTPFHKNVVKQFGPSTDHRLSFEPTWSLMLAGKFDIPVGRDPLTVENILKRKEEKKKGKKRPTLPAAAAAAAATDVTQQQLTNLVKKRRETVNTDIHCKTGVK